MNNFLEETHLRKLANKAAIVSCSNRDKLRVAFEKLIGARIYCLPVFDANTERYVGLLSLGACVGRLVQLFGERCGGMAHINGHEFSQKDVSDIQYSFNNLDITPDLISKVDPMKPGINIQEAINFFVGPGNERSNIRLPIVDEEGKIANIVSPTMILKFLAEHLAELPEQHVSRRIGAIPGLVTPQVRTVKSTERAIDAFALMHLNQFSALGIEDVEGPLHRHIVSAISFKDVSHALKDFSRLLKPVEEYVNEIRREDLVDRAPTMNVASDTSLATTIKKFVAIERHRMFVRDPNSQELVGIVTVSDVLKAFANVQTD